METGQIMTLRFESKAVQGDAYSGLQKDSPPAIRAGKQSAVCFLVARRAQGLNPCARRCSQEEITTRNPRRDTRKASGCKAGSKPPTVVW